MTEPSMEDIATALVPSPRTVRTEDIVGLLDYLERLWGRSEGRIVERIDANERASIARWEEMGKRVTKVEVWQDEAGDAKLIALHLKEAETAKERNDARVKPILTLSQKVWHDKKDLVIIAFGLAAFWTEILGPYLGFK